MTKEELKAKAAPVLDEFDDISRALCVPLPEGKTDLKKDDKVVPELPEDRRWKGPCLGYQIPQDRRPKGLCLIY